MPPRPRKSQNSLWVLGTQAAHRRLLTDAFAVSDSYRGAARYLGIDAAYLIARARELGVRPVWDAD